MEFLHEKCDTPWLHKVYEFLNKTKLLINDITLRISKKL